MKSLLNTRIETSRLLLLPIAMRYKEEIFKEFKKNITIYMYPEPAKDISETEDFINESIKGLRKGDNLQLVILEKNSKEFLGCIGLHHINRNTPELGIWLKNSAHGHKYGQEAMKALKNWADENLTYEYLLYSVADKNIASRKIPELLGGRKIREYEKEGYNWLEYRIEAKKN